MRMKSRFHISLTQNGKNGTNIIEFLISTTNMQFSQIIEPVTGNAEIENQMDITVVFPDASLPSPTNGGFENQEAFRKFVMEHQNGKWKT